MLVNNSEVTRSVMYDGRQTDFFLLNLPATQTNRLQIVLTRAVTQNF